MGPRVCKDCGHLSTSHRMAKHHGPGPRYVTIHECEVTNERHEYPFFHKCLCPAFMMHRRRYKHYDRTGM